MELLVLVLFIGVIVALIRRSKKTASSSIIFKLVCTIILGMLALGSVSMAYDEYDTYQWYVDQYSLDGRITYAASHYERDGLDGLMSQLKYHNSYEPEFEQYWHEIYDAHTQNMELFLPNK